MEASVHRAVRKGSDPLVGGDKLLLLFVFSLLPTTHYPLPTSLPLFGGDRPLSSLLFFSEKPLTVEYARGKITHDCVIR
jgi:hypothetical protein